MLLLISAMLLLAGSPMPNAASTAVSPDSQAVFLELDPAKSWVTGSTTMWFTLADSARTLSLAADSLEIGSLSLSGPRGRVASVWGLTERGLQVDALGGLIPGAYRLEVSFLARWSAQGGWRKGERGHARLDSSRVEAAFPVAVGSASTHWQLHLQTPRSQRARSALSLLRRLPDREVEVSEWRSDSAIPASELRLRLEPRGMSSR